MEITSSELKNIIKESIQESYEKPKATLTIAECANLTGIGRDKLMKLAHSNNSDFPCFKVGTKFLINRKLLSIWLKKISQEKRIL
ncbi:excisionase [Clostridium pasteurianum]|uniref:DNA-binding protein, excisionase family n=1 Tax=Clostridium pasteurianum BC1 TaxID=86416 RepID=R4K215_CLOPA|nr:excisionase [Clostridium pasteurianum]AGK96603.1 DNA-binding protein, excisionase family [Clostridium pasteurianum BC1]